MRQTIHQESFESSDSPVKAISRRTHNILVNGGTEDSLPCDYFYQGKWMPVTPKLLITMIRAVVTTLHLNDAGIAPDLVGNHSLRAEGAMALKLKRHLDTTIIKIGRWSGLTFLQYIHNQIAHLAKEISKNMSQDLPFLNIASIR